MAFNYTKYRKDFVLLFLTRILRMISYGMLAVVFFKNLFNKGFDQLTSSWIQTAIVIGDIAISLYLTTRADKIGRIVTLMIGSLLKLITGFLYAQSESVVILVLAGILGVISVTGGQIGPFMPVEQSALSQLVQKCTDNKQEVAGSIAKVFGYYNMAGYLAQASGSFFAGLFITFSVEYFGMAQSYAITTVVRIYAALGGLMFLGYYFMDNNIEAQKIKEQVAVNCAGIDPTNMKTIVILCILFATDALAGAFVAQSFLSLYYEEKYNKNFSQLGFYLFVCNIVGGISGVLSSKLVAKIGAMATMIYTHLPSNIFLILIALTSNSTLSVFLLFCRFCISQMDVPARQTFVTLVVSPSERSAANGITNIVRSVGLSIGLGLNGYFIQNDPNSFAFSMPFVVAGAIKIIYDVTLGVLFLWKQKAPKNPHFQLSSIQSTDMQTQKQRK